MRGADPRLEPIAVVSAACRLPGGVESPAEYWEFLVSGGDDGRGSPCESGFPDGAARFDAGFFGITPREAQSMDPRQRIVLEVAWEAFERAGIRPGTLRDNRTGVYLGDTAYLDMATTLRVLGPVTTVDTSCSSSLAALHLASTALRQGECDLALAGGVTVPTTPALSIEDGYPEGCGLLVLKLLSRARQDGDRVLAMLRGSAVGQDSQERVVRAATAVSGLTPDDIDVVEAHVTGVLKIVLALQHETLPSRAQPWRRGRRPRRAGVSEFGLSATHAHVIVEEAPAESRPAARDLGPGLPIVVSGRDAAARAANAERLADYLLRNGAGSLADVALSAGSRTHFDCRGAVVATDLADAAKGLRALAAGEERPGVCYGRGAGPLVLRFPGEGAERAGMGSDLSAVFPIHRAAFAEVGAALEAGDLPGHAAPALFAAEVARYRLLESWGVTPAAVVGDGVGELAAAHVAGALSLDDAARLAVARDRLTEAEYTRLLAECPRARPRFPIGPPAGDAFELDPLCMTHAYPLASGNGEVGAIMSALAALYASGHDLDWDALLAGTGATRVPIPTYAFQRDRYWVTAGRQHRDLCAAGLQPLPHPWLRAVSTTADGAGFLFTGRLSLSAQPWLADHVVFGTVVVPGSGFLELVAGVARQVGAVGVGELTLSEPLALCEAGHVNLRVTVGPLHVDGRRSVAVHSQREESWTLHASGQLIDDPVADGRAGFAELAEWPVAGATTVDPADIYDAYDRLGQRYGSAFRGLVEVHRRGTVAYGLARLPAGLTAGYEVHPALLDAALHTLAAGPELLVPAEWRGVELRATASTVLRVRVERTSGRSARVWFADEHGYPVAYVDELRLRPVSAEQIRGSEPIEHLYRVEYQPVEPAPVPTIDRLTVIGDGVLADLLGVPTVPIPSTVDELCTDGRPERIVVDLTADPNAATVPAGVERVTVDTLLLLQLLLADSRLDGSELVFLTSGAGLLGPPVWGLVRSVREEHPERVFRLIDIDPDGTPAALAAALGTTGEPELVVTGGEVTAPRLVPVGAVDRSAGPVLDPEGTVLITGGTGELGRRVARHLVVEHRMRHLLLTSRRGPDAPDVAELIDELLDAGADQVWVRACDMADRDDVAALLSDVDSQHPLVAVLHLAGVLDDRLVAGQDPKRFARVLAPKVAGAWHLHTLTRGRPLAAFVLFSSLSGVLGSAGQSNDATANAFLDALATHRRANGLVATSLSWGLWEQSHAGMTAHLGEAELARLGRQGIGAFSPKQGLKAFDTALALPEPHLVPVRLDPVRRQQFGDSGEPPALLRGLVRPAHRRAAGDPPRLRDRLAALTEGQRLDELIQLVRREAAVVLGAEVDEVGAREVLGDAGMDSLMAVELRQRLTAAAGVPLSAALVVDHPTPAAIARLILARLALGTEPLRADPTDTAEASTAAIGIVSAADWPAGDGERFDAAFFGISAAQASTIGAPERLLLEAAWTVFERAGITRETLAKLRVGVYLGAGAAADRVAHTFGLRGPALTIDAGDSSTQVAVQLANTALRQGDCDLALAGGVDSGLIVLKRLSVQDNTVTEKKPLPAYPVVLSGRDHTALRHQAGSWADWLDANPDVALPALAWTAATHRTHFDCRAAVAAAGVDELRVALRALANGVPHADVVEATAKPRGRVAFVFPGESGQWLGMGRALLRQSTAFARAAAACEDALRPLTGWSVLDVLTGENDLDLDRAEVVQPALFTMHVALAAAWRTLGVEPAAVAGYGLGEVAAAVVAGVLTVEQGARIVVLRSRVVQDRGGRDLSMQIALPVAEVERRLGGELTVTAVHTATSTAVSGESAAVSRFARALAADGVPARLVDTGAVPGWRLDDLLPLLAVELSRIRPQSARIPFYATVIGSQDFDGEYWCRNLREPVRLDNALARLAADGHDVLIEVGPHPVLASALADGGGAVGASLSRGSGGVVQLMRALGSLHTNGFPVDWPQVLPGRPGTPVELPTYAFQRRRHPLPANDGAPALGLVSTAHPWLGAATALAGGDGWLLTGRFTLTEHAVAGAVVLELALAAARQAGATGIASLSLAEPVPHTVPLRVQVRVGPATTGRYPLSVYSQREAAEVWTRQATGELVVDSVPSQWPAAGTPAAEVRLPAGAAPGEFLLHPELLGAALCLGPDLPVAWTDVRLHAAGATELRVRFADGGLWATDLVGRPVLSARKLG